MNDKNDKNDAPAVTYWNPSSGNHKRYTTLADAPNPPRTHSEAAAARAASWAVLNELRRRLQAAKHAFDLQDDHASSSALTMALRMLSTLRDDVDVECRGMLETLPSERP